MTRSATLLCLALSFAATYADEESASRGISTPGTASILVSPDQFEVDFGLLTEEDSFSAAVDTAREMEAKLRGLKVVGWDLSISVDHDLTYWTVRSSPPHSFLTCGPGRGRF